MDKSISVLAIFVLGILAVGIMASNTPDISIDDSYIIKDKIKVIKDDGVYKKTKEMLYLDCDLKHPSDLYIEATLLDKKNRTIGKASRIIRDDGEYKIFIPYRKNLERVNYTIYSRNFYQLKPLYNGSVSKIVKDSHTINRTTHKKKAKTKTSTKTSSSSNYNSDSSSSGSSYSSYSSSSGSSGSSYSSYSSSGGSGNSYASEEVTGGSYVASKNSDKFHHYYCGHAKRIKSKNRIYFSSRQEALNSGYDPCKTCNP